MPRSALATPSLGHARGRLFLILSAAAFSTAGFFSREAPVDIWAMVFWRNASGSVALMVLILVTQSAAPDRASVRLGPWGWATVGTSAFATVCFLGALAHTSVADVSIIYATAPLMTALVAWLWLREKATRTTLGAAVLALGGVAVTIAGSIHGGRLLGDGLALMMAVSLSFMTVIARRHARLPPLLTACLASLVAAAAVLPIGWASGVSFAVSWQAMAWLSGFGVVTMAIALPCYLAGAAAVPAGPAMLISALEMPLAPLWVWLAFAERPSPAAMIGGSVVALAIIWQLSADRKRS